MKHWRQVRKPVYFQSGRDDDAWPADWIRIFNRFDLRNILSNAILDRHDVVSNWFIFARMEDPPGPEHAHALELITPALCQGLVRALETVECADIFAGAVHAVFSYRQRQILQWIYHGKTNWEISRILDINEETVKYHVEQAMKKLDVATRAQAVGRALEIGIIAAAKQP
jgi:DNA-binding CsgD family transcriptional regulator